MGEIVKLENPAVEQKKIELTRALVNDQNQMKAIEDGILNQLVNSTGNILDDEDLIRNLDESKVVSTAVKLSMEENKTAQVEISEARLKYQVVAERGKGGNPERKAY